MNQWTHTGIDRWWQAYLTAHRASASVGVLSLAPAVLTVNVAAVEIDVWRLL